MVLRKWTKPRAEPVDRDTASRQQQQVMDGLVSWSLFERIFFFLTFIDLAVSGLSCGTRDFRCVMRAQSLWHVGSVVAARRHGCPTACGIYFPN